METYSHEIDEKNEQKKIKSLVNNNRKTVVIQGLGFVGSAMVAALTQAKNKKGNLLYNVIGVDLADKENYWKICRANKGKPPIISSDKSINIAYSEAKKIKTF